MYKTGCRVKFFVVYVNWQQTTIVGNLSGETINCSLLNLCCSVIVCNYCDKHYA